MNFISMSLIISLNVTIAGEEINLISSKQKFKTYLLSLFSKHNQPISQLLPRGN